MLTNTGIICSAETAGQVDKLVIAEVQKQYNKAKTLLSNNLDKLHELAEYLLKEETITRIQFMKILNQGKLII